ncbi:MAG: 5'/3'-nucleotidase SurE [Candidatus Nezhaarchaeales archaeon]
MPVILLTNDDGFSSIGLLAAKKALEGLGNVVVVAPDKEYSGMGKALTLSKRLHVNEVKLADGSKAYVVNGTPADAVLIALFKILKGKPDLLVSGINLGPNVGMEDLLDSATVGAALEAALHGVKSVALSYALSRDPLKRGLKVSIKELKPSMEALRRIAKAVLVNGMPKGVDLLSVNVPPGGWIGVKVTTPSRKAREDIHVEENGGSFYVRGWDLSVYPDDRINTDVGALKQGFLTITPLKALFPSSRLNLNILLKGVGQL